MDDLAIELSAVADQIRGRALARNRQRGGESSRALRFAALVASALVQIGVLVLLARAMHFEFYESPDALHVTLYSAPPAGPALPEPPPRNLQPFVMRPRANASVAGGLLRAHDRTPDGRAAPDQTKVGADESPPELALFNPDGSIKLPNGLPRISDEIQAKPADSPIMQPLRRGRVRPNHFDAVWREPAHNLSLSNAVIKFVADKLNTSEKVLRLPWGTKVVCSSGFALGDSEKGTGRALPSSSGPARVLLDLGGWCGFGYAPPADGTRPSESWKPSTDLDAR
jgi:hypothetical protein